MVSWQDLREFLYLLRVGGGTYSMFGPIAICVGGSVGWSTLEGVAWLVLVPFLGREVFLGSFAWVALFSSFFVALVA